MADKTKPRFKVKTKQGKVVLKVRPWHRGRVRLKPWVVLLSRRAIRSTFNGNERS